MNILQNGGIKCFQLIPKPVYILLFSCDNTKVLIPTEELDFLFPSLVVLTSAEMILWNGERDENEILV